MLPSIILKWKLKKYFVRSSIGLIWLSMWLSGGGVLSGIKIHVDLQVAKEGGKKKGKAIPLQAVEAYRVMRYRRSHSV
jgi:hypothetical protein